VSELWLPAVIAAAALVLTYLFCVRPMRRAHGGNASNGHAPAHLDQALIQARAELTRLRQDRAQGVAAGSDRPPATGNRQERT
jgi:hypothetical protein